MARTKYAIKLNRTNRFLIDDPDAPKKIAYQLTKPLKGNLTYNNKGTYSFVLQEVQSTDYDNIELGIADYYKHFPKHKAAPLNVDDDIDANIDTDDETDSEQDNTQDSKQEHKDENNGKKVYI